MSRNSSPREVAIVAAGVISPLGRGLAETTAALREGRDCVSPVTSFDVSKTRSKTAGQIPDEWLADSSATRKQKRLHRASKMMIAAMGELVSQDRNFAPELMVIGTTS